MKNITKSVKFATIDTILATLPTDSTFAEGLTVADLREFVAHEQELLAKKNAATATKPTKAQQANADTKAHLLEVMANGEAHTVTEWQDADEALSALSNQKVSALMRQLVTDGKVTKTVDKRRALFAIVQG